MKTDTDYIDPFSSEEKAGTQKDTQAENVCISCEG